jgi:transposase
LVNEDWHIGQKESVMDATTIGIDLAKDVFEIAISTSTGRVSARRRLSRRQFGAFVETLQPGTTVVMEACGTAHYWGRRCRARGAEVQLLPAQYVRPYVRRNKTDRADADALLEAHRCRAIHAVPLKTVEQQTLQALHRVRAQWQRTRTARINLVRALLREQGVYFAVGAKTIHQRIAAVVADAEAPLPAMLRETAWVLLDDIRSLEARLRAVDQQLTAVARVHPIARRLQQIPGVGVITATALVASVPHIDAFRRGRPFASWLGLTPRESSSGERRTVGRISKRGNPYLRTLLIHGARSALRVAQLRATQPGASVTHLQRWALATAARRGTNRAAVALANKMARIIWAMWTRDRDFASPLIAA